MQRRRRTTGDYARAEEYLKEIKEDIEFEQGAKYEDLSRVEQRQTLLDHFFKGIPQYEASAEEMRKGIAITGIVKGGIMKIDVISLRGKKYRVIRDVKTGRFRQWVRE